jgi:hypothetical protein
VAKTALSAGLVTEAVVSALRRTILDAPDDGQ